MGAGGPPQPERALGAAHVQGRGRAQADVGHEHAQRFQVPQGLEFEAGFEKKVEGRAACCGKIVMVAPGQLLEKDAP
jgi:hypothetical protein